MVRVRPCDAGDMDHDNLVAWLHAAFEFNDLEALLALYCWS